MAVVHVTSNGPYVHAVEPLTVLRIGTKEYVVTVISGNADGTAVIQCQDLGQYVVLAMGVTDDDPVVEKQKAALRRGWHLRTERT